MGTSKAKPEAPSANRLGIQGSSIIKTARRVAAEQVEESKRRRSGGNVQRFFVPRGEEKEILILDESIEKGWGMWEHTIRGRDGKFNRHVPCVKDFANCPICAMGERSYYAVFLSILDLTPWETAEGKEVPYTKRLMCIKSGQLETIARIQEAAMEKYGTLRGCYLVMARGEGDKTAAMGEPAPQKGAKLFQMYSEDEIVDEFGHEQVLDKKTKEVWKKANEDIKPFKYAQIFQEPDIEALEEEFGDAEHPTPGSRRQSTRGRAEEYDETEDEAPRRSPKNRKVARDEPEDDEDEVPVKKRRAPVDDDEEEETPKAKSKRHKFDADDDEDEVPVKKSRRAPVDDDDDEDEAPVRSKRRPVVADDDDEDEVPVKKRRKAVVEEDEEEDEVPVRKSRRTPVVDDDEDEDEVPVKKSRRAPVVEDDDDDEEEEPAPVKKRRPVVDEAPRKVHLKKNPARKRASDPFEDGDD